MPNKDYRDILQLLLENQVDFLIIGAYAMGAHGFPRATGDIDIWVKADKLNSKKVYKVLEIFGAPMEKIESTILKKMTWFTK